MKFRHFRVHFPQTGRRPFPAGRSRNNTEEMAYADFPGSYRAPDPPRKPDVPCSLIAGAPQVAEVPDVLDGTLTGRVSGALVCHRAGEAAGVSAGTARTIAWSVSAETACAVFHKALLRNTRSCRNACVLDSLLPGHRSGQTGGPVMVPASAACLTRAYAGPVSVDLGSPWG